MAIAAPAAGTMLNRLVGYAWPAFWLATPLMAGALKLNRRQGIRLGTMQLIAALAVPLLAINIPWAATWSVPALAATALLGIGLNFGAAVIVRESRFEGKNSNC